MSASAQGMRVSATVRKQWVQNVAAVVLDTVEQLIIRVFDQLGGRRHGGNRHAHHGVEIPQCAAGLRPW